MFSCGNALGTWVGLSLHPTYPKGLFLWGWVGRGALCASWGKVGYNTNKTLFTIE